MLFANRKFLRLIANIRDLEGVVVCNIKSEVSVKVRNSAFALSFYSYCSTNDRFAGFILDDTAHLYLLARSLGFLKRLDDNVISLQLIGTVGFFE